MSLFDLKDGNITVKPEILLIPEFKVIWKRDKSRTKLNAMDEFAYIYYMADFNSPYANYPIKEKEKRLKLFLEKRKLKVDDKIKEAIRKYAELQETRSIRLLQSAMIACDKLADYFENIDFTLMDDSGKLIYTAKDVATNLANVGKIVESLNKLEEQVKKERKSSITIRGGGDVGLYER